MDRDRDGVLKVLLVLVLVLTYSLVRSQSDLHGPDYYCLEDYKPIGNVLHKVVLSVKDKAGTSGHIARQCSVACSADPSCTAFKAVGHAAPSGPSCLLLTNTTAALPAALSVPPGADWPRELVSLSANGSLQLRPVGRLCLRGAGLWDKLGQATHAAIHKGSAAPPYPNFGHQYYCAFGTDTAGTNLQQYTSNIKHPVDCDALCANSTAGSCQFWTFVASQPDTGQAPYNCFLRTDSFAGENGYTGKPKPDIWIPDSEMECFTQLADWRQLGVILSPAVKTIPYGGVYYTLFPERVTWQEANDACSSMPGSQLATLDTRGAIDIVYRELLSTLSPETGVTSAWVGAMGSNTHYNATAQNQTGLFLQLGGMSLQQISQLLPQPVRNRSAPGPETTLVWSDGRRVDSSQLRRLIRRTEYWSAHDVIWNQQYVPDSSKSVCGRVLIQTPPMQPLPGVDISAAVLPGLWYFDCTRLAAYVCQSDRPLVLPMVGRTALTDTNNATEPPSPEAFAPNWRIAVAVIVPTFVVLLILWQMSCMYSPQVSRLPELIRQQHKRALGQPRYGRMSIVVTDIQGFTNLMRDAPDDSAQALLTHNQVMKQACYEHVGYILEQEGDSFTMAFHEPQDAVAFTLQVQQALLEQPWSPAVSYHDTWENTASIINCQTASQAAMQQQQAGRISVERGPSTLTDNPSSRRLSQRSSLDHASPFFGWITGSVIGNSSIIHANGRGANTAAHNTKNNPDFPWSVDPMPVTALSMAETDYGLPPRSAFSRRKATWLQQMLSPGQQRANQAALFRGLRVRMGVATGVVRKDEEVKSSALYKTAQDVSNAAVGGEVLLDELTFLQIKEDLWRLGLITATGLDYNTLHAGRSSTSGNKDPDDAKSAGRRVLDCVKLRRAFSYTQVRPNAQHALALDMGCFEVTGAAVNRQATCEPAGGTSTTSCLLWSRETGDALVRHYQEFLQHQLQHRRDRGHTSEATGDAFMSVDSEQMDLEHGHRGSSETGRSRVGSVARQHLQSWLSMQQQQLGVMQLQEQHWWQQQQQQQGDQDTVQSHQPVERWRWRHLLLGGGLKPWSRHADKQEGNLSTISPRALSMSNASTWSMSQVTQGHPTVRLYQVAAPRLVGRAALFGSQLALPAGWVMLDAPYFAAPGLTAMTDSGMAGSPTHQAQQQQQQMLPQQRLTNSLSASSNRVQPVAEQYSSAGEGLLQQGSVQQLPLYSSAGDDGDGPDVPGHASGDNRDQDVPRTAAAAAAAGANGPVATSNGSSRLQVLDRSVSPFAVAAAAAESSNSSVEHSAGSSSNVMSEQQHQMPAAVPAQIMLPVVSPSSAGVSPPVVASSSALLRGMSLRAEWALPSLTRAGSAAGAAAAAAQAAAGLGPGAALRPQYPAVTVVFAMVEEAQQLLRQPLLARPTHLLIQRLMLKTLTAFPGSYLVRAQEGDLKYMAAFPSPAAAAEWCVTVQEASLYLPYPLEVLALSSCGVQLDATGRLVFRGPRFKMGVSEGTPRCILPDHMGRADYHGPFVNQGARYADAAAHGGQIVSDGQLAKQIIAHWHNRNNSSGSSTTSDSRRGSSFDLVGSTGRNWQSKQQHRRLMRAQSAEGCLMLDHHCGDHSHQHTTFAAGAGAGPDGGLPVAFTDNALLHPAAAGFTAPAVVTPVDVECDWHGSFLFKGNPQPVEMVSFAPVVLRGRSYPAAAPGGKGTRLVQRVGVLDRVTVQLPAVLEGFRLQ